MTEAASAQPEQPRKEIILPKDTIRPLGKALQQAALPSIKAMQTDITRFKTEPSLAPFTAEIIMGIAKTDEIFRRLQTAREVKLVEGEGGMYKLVLSPDDEESALMPNTATMDEQTTRAFAFAITDAVNNSTAVVVGYAELASFSSDMIAEPAQSIIDSVKEISRVANSFNEATETKITTREDLSVTYEVIK